MELCSENLNIPSPYIFLFMVFPRMIPSSFSHPFVTETRAIDSELQVQRGLVRRPEALPQSSAFLGIGFSSRHEFAGEYTRR